MNKNFADISPAHHRRRPAYAATFPRQVYELFFSRQKRHTNCHTVDRADSTVR